MVRVTVSASSFVDDLGQLDVVVDWHAATTAVVQVCNQLAIPRVYIVRF
jgi:hypothetical protein